MTAASPDTPLEAIRREIDTIDDQILKLLMQRFAATERVKRTKAHDGSISSSPFRPAREAAMMHRLLDAAGKSLDPELLVRLWRVILSASIQSQAPVTLHVDTGLAGDLALRLLIAQHFIAMPVEVHASPAQALERLAARPGDLALVAPASEWTGAFMAGRSGDAIVVGTLPVLLDEEVPRILVFGHVAAQPSGDDETLLLLPTDSTPVPGALWHLRSGAMTLAALPGFHDERASSASRLAGRYPRPIKVSP